MEGQEVTSVNTGDPAAALAERRVLKIQTTLYQGPVRPTWDLRRARCGESRTAGSGSGPGKRAGRKTGTAPRTDFTTLTARTGHSDSSRPPAALPPSSGAAIRPWLRDRSAASFTSTCRSPDLTEFSEPTGTSELRVYGVDSSGRGGHRDCHSL